VTLPNRDRIALFYYSDRAKQFFSHAIFALECSTCLFEGGVPSRKLPNRVRPPSTTPKPCHRTPHNLLLRYSSPLFPRRYLPLFNLHHHGKYYQSSGVVNDCCISHKFKHCIHISTNKFFNLMQSKNTSFHGWWLGK